MMNTTKKTLLGAAITATMMSAPLVANAANSGFYFGGQAGWTDSHIEVNDASGVEINGLSGTGVSGALVAGVQRKISSGIMVAEVNLGDSSAEYEQRDATSQTTITSDLSYGVSAKLGTDVSRRTQAYGLVGYQFTDMEFKSRDAAVGGVNIVSLNDTYSGPRFGFGIQTQVSRDLTMRMEWTRTLYGDKDINDNNSTLEPTESQFSVGVVGFF